MGASRPRSNDSAKSESVAIHRLEPLLELARSGREEDFRWLARSRGMPGERIDKLWKSIRAWVVACDLKR